MPQYFYIAKSKESREVVSDVMEASDEKELASNLREEGLYLIKSKVRKGKGITIPFLDRVSLADKIFLTKNLQVMLSGGLSLSRALKVLSLQAKSNRLRVALLEIRGEISKGKSFSQALENYPEIFSDMFQSMVRVAEETGTMEDNLRIMTEQLEKEYELKSKVKGALIYPIVIVSVMILVGIIMMVVVVPQLAETFDTMGVELPFATRMIIGFGNMVAENWKIIPLLFLLLFFLIKKGKKTRRGKAMIDKLSLKIPLISPFIKKQNTAYTARTLNSLLSSKVPIIQALEILSGNISNKYFKQAIEESVEVIKKGGTLSQALKPHSDLYSPLMIQMIEVGEETGKTSEVLSKTAAFLEEEVFNFTKNLTSTIEPILMVIIGVVVGFFALSMLQPIYSIFDAL